MLRGYIESMLGEYGTRLLYFYEANAWPINTVVLIYGSIMLLSWISTLRIYKYMVVEMAKQIHLHPDLNRKSTVKQIRDTIEVPWQQAVDASPFPLVARQGAVYPIRKSVENMQRILDDSELAPHALEVLKGTHLRNIRPTYLKMRKKELAEKNVKFKSD